MNPRLLESTDTDPFVQTRWEIVFITSQVKMYQEIRLKKERKRKRTQKNEKHG